LRENVFHPLKIIDDFISNVNQKLDYTKYLTPTNLNEQNSKFFDNFKKGIEYNPRYNYQPYDDINFDSLKNQIEEFKLSDSTIENIFKRYLSVLGDHISFYQNRGNSRKFTEYSVKAFGVPDKKLVEKAYQIISTPSEINIKADMNKIYDAHDLASKLKNRLYKYGFDWQIVILETSTTKVTVDPEIKVIYLNNSLKYSEADLERLQVHEIDTHVVRAENGALQPFKIFSTGLANSLTTEEGLAVTSEEMNNVLDHSALRILAGRTIAVALAVRESFFSVFTELAKYFNENDALNITQRVKKGLSDTSDCGGFTKDYIYFDGYYSLKEYLNLDNDPEILFVGVIGLEDIPDIRVLLETNDLKVPKNIPSGFMRR